MTDKALPEGCPACGALPCDQVDDPRAKHPMTNQETAVSRVQRLDVARVIQLCEERAATYGALRQSSLTSIALDRASALLRALARHRQQASPGEGVVEEIRWQVAREIASWKPDASFDDSGLGAAEVGAIIDNCAEIARRGAAFPGVASLKPAPDRGAIEEREVDLLAQLSGLDQANIAFVSALAAIERAIERRLTLCYQRADGRGINDIKAVQADIAPILASVAPFATAIRALPALAQGEGKDNV